MLRETLKWNYHHSVIILVGLKLSILFQIPHEAPGLRTTIILSPHRLPPALPRVVRDGPHQTFHVVKDGHVIRHGRFIVAHHSHLSSQPCVVAYFVHIHCHNSHHSWNETNRRLPTDPDVRNNETMQGNKTVLPKTIDAKN